MRQRKSGHWSRRAVLIIECACQKLNTTAALRATSPLHFVYAVPKMGLEANVVGNHFSAARCPIDGRSIFTVSPMLADFATKIDPE